MDRVVPVDIWYRLILKSQVRQAEAFAYGYRQWVLDREWADLVDQGSDVY